MAQVISRQSVQTLRIANRPGLAIKSTISDYYTGGAGRQAVITRVWYLRHVLASAECLTLVLAKTGVPVFIRPALYRVTRAHCRLTVIQDVHVAFCSLWRQYGLIRASVADGLMGGSNFTTLVETMPLNQGSQLRDGPARRGRYCWPSRGPIIANQLAVAVNLEAMRLNERR